MPTYPMKKKTAKMRIYPSFAKRLREEGVDLKNDTIKVRLRNTKYRPDSAMRPSGDDVVLDVDQLSPDWSTFKPTLMFIGSKCIHLEHTGAPITDAARLTELVNERKSVWVACWGRRSSAAWLTNMPFSIVMQMLRNGYLYEYTPKGKVTIC